MCPSCPTQYRVPEVFQGRNLACKKCGTVFKIDFKATPQQGKAPPSPSDVQADIEKISREDHGLVIGKLASRYHLATKEQVRDAIDLKRLIAHALAPANSCDCPAPLLACSNVRA